MKDAKLNLEEALKIIAEFKGSNLKSKLNDLKYGLIGKSKSEFIDFDGQLFDASLIVKYATNQINEIVHATGIIKCLPKILDENEVVLDLSLASGSEGSGFDLVTNLRIAEFKFSRWQEDSTNGMRKRQIFIDFVHLLMNESTKRKQLYVYGAEKIKIYLQSKRANWKKTLSKSGGLDILLDQFLVAKNINAIVMYDVFSITEIDIIDLDGILS
jgi:hypothetical protein